MTIAASGRVSRFAVLAVLAGLGACVGPDESLPPPIEPVRPAARVPLAVPPTRNDSPLPVVADFTAGTNAMLVALLERTGRFVPDDDAAVQLETAITAVRDEDATEGVVYRDASRAGLRRRAVVEMRYRLVDGAGRTLLEGAVRGDDVLLGRPSIPIPSRVDLETGAYWNSTMGRATRACLDAVVRQVTERA